MLEWVSQRLLERFANKIDLRTGVSIRRATPNSPALSLFLAKARKNNSIQAYRVRAKLPLLSALKERDCPVCLSTLAQPIQTECGHTFCQNCLAQSIALRQECPICRRAIEQFVLSKTKIMSELIQPSPRRKQSACKRRLQKRVQVVFEGKLVDLLLGKVWCPGIVKKVVREQEQTFLYIEINLNGNSKLFKVQGDSLRIASRGCYSKEDSRSMGEVSEHADIKQVDFEQAWQSQCSWWKGIITIQQQI